MEALTIVTYGHPVLKAKAKPVTVFDDKLQELIEGMAVAMYEEPGIGLAAPQVAVSLQLCVVDLGVQEDKPGSEFMVLINPEIISREGKISYEEGCLSVPGFNAEIERAQTIKVKALDRHGKPFELTATDLRAVCIQHEMDHLNGVTILDRVSALKKQMYLKKLKKGKIDTDTSVAI